MLLHVRKEANVFMSKDKLCDFDQRDAVESALGNIEFGLCSGY